MKIVQVKAVVNIGSQIIKMIKVNNIAIIIVVTTILLNGKVAYLLNNAKFRENDKVLEENKYKSFPLTYSLNIQGDIKLDNGYILVNGNKQNLNDIVYIQNINWEYIQVNKNLFFKIDFNTLNHNEYKIILKKMLRLKKKAEKYNINVNRDNPNKILGYILNYNIDCGLQQNFINGIDAIFHNTKYDMYNYIYSIVCGYLDFQFVQNNLCDFKNNKCIEKRNTNSLEGCCHTFKNKWFGFLSIKNNFIICKYFKNNSCSIQCISCKLFTCGSLNKKGVYFKISDIFLLDTFFGILQKYIIKFSVYTPKEVIIKRLLFWSKI